MTYLEQIEQVRADVKAAALRALRADLCKTLIFWLIAPTVFYFATRENKLLGPSSNLPMFLAIVLILMLLPVLRLQLWKYRTLLRSATGKVHKKKTGLERVPRTDRNTGYVTGRDMVPTNVLYLTIQKSDSEMEKNKMVGGHLFSLGQAYYEEGDTVERFVGARYYYNPDNKLSRPFCLRCGYIGSPNEVRCSRCRCTMLPIGQNIVE
jgi:hypothetical protein